MNAVQFQRQLKGYLLNTVLFHPVHLVYVGMSNGTFFCTCRVFIECCAFSLKYKCDFSSVAAGPHTLTPRESRERPVQKLIDPKSRIYFEILENTLYITSVLVRLVRILVPVARNFAIIAMA